MKLINKLGIKKAVLTVSLSVSAVVSVQAQLVCNGKSINGPKNPGWRDSVSVGGKCYCVTTFDHEIGDIVPAGAGGLTVRQVCDLIGPPPAGNQIPYNDIQCGNGPANDAGDEDADCCPGRVDQGPSGCLTIGPKWDLSGISGGNNNERVVTLRKRNATGFGIDGNHGGSNGQNVYLWTYSANNANQRWIEVDRGNGFFSYVKQSTNFALDGGNGGKNNQNVHLWSYNTSNQNQQWKKVSKGGSSFQLQKRNAINFCLAGGVGGARGQNVKIFTVTNSSQNQQWIITEQ